MKNFYRPIGIFLVILLFEYLKTGFQNFTILYVLKVLSIAFIWGLGITYFLSIILSKLTKVKVDYKKLIFNLPLVLLTTSSIFLYQYYPDIFFVVWIVTIGLVLLFIVNYLIKKEN